MNTDWTPLYVEASFAALSRSLQQNARTDCFRCEYEPAGKVDPLEPEPGLCSACLHEVSAMNENRRLEQARHDLAGPDYTGWVA